MRSGIPVTIKLASGGSSEPVTGGTGRGAHRSEGPGVTGGSGVRDSHSGTEVGNQITLRSGFPGTNGRSTGDTN